MVTLIHVVIIMRASTIHPSWDRSGWRVHIKFSVSGFYREFTVALSEFKLYLEVWAGCEGWFMCRWGS
jgi:hypothetical protein